MPAFTSATAGEAAAKSHATRRDRTELCQAVELQDLAYKAAVAISSTLSPSEKMSREDALALAAVLRSYDVIANRASFGESRFPARVDLPWSRRDDAKLPGGTFRLPLFTAGLGKP